MRGEGLCHQGDILRQDNGRDVLVKHLYWWMLLIGDIFNEELEDAEVKMVNFDMQTAENDADAMKNLGQIKLKWLRYTIKILIFYI